MAKQNSFLPDLSYTVGFIFDEFAEGIFYDDSLWNENNEKQTLYINQLLREMSLEASSRIGKNVNFLRYNDYTIAITGSVKSYAQIWFADSA